MKIALRAAEDHRQAEPELELEPDSVLLCQLGDRLFGAARLQAEKRLQLAVLQDAVLTFHRLTGVKAARPRRLFAEVDDWFASEESDGPFTFATICDTLNLDPDYIRQGLRRWRALVDGAETRAAPFRRESNGQRHRVGPRGSDKWPGRVVIGTQTSEEPTSARSIGLLPLHGTVGPLADSAAGSPPLESGSRDKTFSR